jgi:hypothetical protein
MMRRLVIVGLGSLMFAALGTLAGAAPGNAPSSAAAGDNPLVGTWRLVSSSSPSAVGLMMYDSAGYFGLALMQPGRQKYAGSEPTSSEAKAAFESFASFFGTYSVKQPGTVAFHLDGSLDPNQTNSDHTSAYELVGDRLTLKHLSTLIRPRGTFVWERLPASNTMTATQRRLIGFWKLVPNEGEKVEPAAANQDHRRGFIIYDASGNMAVHIMPAGRPRHAGAEPSGDEAKTALRSYTSYFGPYTVNEKDGYIVHQRIGHTIPGSIGTNGQRFYEFKGNRLVLSFVSTTFTVPTTIQAAKAEGREPGKITWERISREATPGTRSR